jgi:chemotaxis family two-component system response regulator Rcp1
MATDGRALEILVAEDNPGDVALIREALREGGAGHRLSVAPDGIAALARLRHPGGPRPDLVLLDLNLARLDGRAVLAALRADPALRTLPVVVFSSSSEPRDVVAAYAHGANAYVAKPLTLDGFLAAVGGIVAFWGAVALLPA